MTIEIDINLELRSEVLHFALKLERDVNSLLLVLLSIENTQRKAISNKSGNLSFKNKIDLLFDLDVLNSDEHKKLLLLMEFRNQVLHNIECNSFEKTVDLLGPDKGRKLLDFDDTGSNEVMENRYKCAFRNLYFECLKIILIKIEDRRNQVDCTYKTLINLHELHVYMLESYFGTLDKIFTICENRCSEVPEVIKLIDNVVDIINKDVLTVFSSEKYTEMQRESDELHAPERFKALFKR
jgi:hypothetical protein